MDVSYSSPFYFSLFLPSPWLPNLTTWRSDFLSIHNALTHRSPTRAPVHIAMRARAAWYTCAHSCFGMQKQRWLGVFFVLCGCAAMIPKQANGTHTQTHTRRDARGEEVASQCKNTCLSLSSSYPCLLLFFCPLALLFLTSLFFSPLIAHSPPLPPFISTSPECHHPDCKHRWWITNCPALDAVGWRQIRVGEMGCGVGLCVCVARFIKNTLTVLHVSH